MNKTIDLSADRRAPKLVSLGNARRETRSSFAGTESEANLVMKNRIN